MSSETIAVEVVRVFCNAHGGAGNHLGVVLEAQRVSTERRQAIAADLGYAETIFVQDGARIQIFTPAMELPFAGHPLVGAAWRLGVPFLYPPAGKISARALGDRAWIVARPDQSPAWDSRQLASPADVDALRPPAHGHLQYWAWKDEDSGHIRARVFPVDYGIPEDPATGSASIVLCHRLARSIVIDQGAGSIIEARPLGDGTIEVGGRVVSDGTLRLER